MKRAPSALSRRTMLKTAGAAGAAAALHPVSPFRANAAMRFQGGDPVPGGTLTYGNSKPTQNIISPLNTIGTGQNVLIEAMFLRLVYGRQWGDGINPDPNNTEIELAVAETMEEIEPNRVWEFSIRENVLWHDGQPVTVDDVIYGIWLSLHPEAGATNETPVVGILGADKLREQGGTEVVIDGATKIGDRGLRIELEKPIPNYWVNWNVGYWPMPKHIYGDMPFEEIWTGQYATMPIGNGPFKAANYVDGQYMEMDANPDFYLGKPLLDKFIVRFGDADTLTAALEAQEIDGCGLSAGPVYDRLTSLDYIVGNPVPRDHPDGFVINHERWPDHAAALTKATMHALDISTLNAQLYNDTLRPSNYLFEHVVGLETPPEGFPTYEYDPEKARAILEEAGWDSSTELEWTMWSPPTPSTDAMQALLADAGITTVYRPIDAATVVEELYNAGNYDIVFANFGAYQSMEDNWQYIKCGFNREQGGANYARYCNEEVDALWQQALDEPDPELARPIWDEVTMAMAEDPPQGTVYRSSVIYAWNTRVRGAYPYQYRLPVRPAFEKVWIAPAE